MIILDLTLSPFWQLVVESLLRTARMVGVVAGLIAFVDCFRPQAHPLCNRRANARAWAWVGMGAFIGGLLTLYATFGAREPKPDVTLARLILWVCLATGLTTRCACRAERPGIVWLVACLLGVAGMVFSIADTLVS